MKYQTRYDVFRMVSFTEKGVPRLAQISLKLNSSFYFMLLNKISILDVRAYLSIHQLKVTLCYCIFFV